MQDEYDIELIDNKLGYWGNDHPQLTKEEFELPNVGTYLLLIPRSKYSALVMSGGIDSTKSHPIKTFKYYEVMLTAAIEAHLRLGWKYSVNRIEVV